MGLITASCDASIPRRKRRGSHRPAYWWSQEIAELRKSCHELRRRATRAAKRSLTQDLPLSKYKQAKKNRAIKASKAKLWREICNNLDGDIWGKAYHIVVKRLGKALPESPKPPALMNSIVAELFPKYPPREKRHYAETTPFTIKKLQDAAKILKSGKASGPDGILTLVINTVALDFPAILLNAYNACLEMGTFSAIWKQQSTTGQWQSLKARKVCLILTLDIKNSFNSANWGDILDALEHKFDADPANLAIVHDYLNERTLLAETTEGTQEYEITAGVSQGSIMGTDLWNTDYDELLEFPLPKQVELKGFADNVTATIVVDSVEEADLMVRETIDTVETWLEKHHLKLAKQKTEMVVLTRQKWFPKPFTVDVGGTTLTTTRAQRYLGVMIDEKLSFREHLENACTKANRTVSSLSRKFERVKLYDAIRNGDNSKEARTRIKTETLQEWQDRWTSGETGRWMARLIPDINVWLSRKHGETDFFLTQFLKVHGRFNDYLFRMRLHDKPTCKYCLNKIDDAEHTFFEYARWKDYRNSAEEMIDARLSPSSLVTYMITQEENWSAVAAYAQHLLRDKINERDQ
ncbi:uncharacterized protein LOC124369442 [Homalodisca vitripennis]|uniref:uncharacterized protein LOC124369442 n=1 Tax=Homalodisca vitripennis TaxID=197043 RepID=UPI001EECEA27|nr:uncharacterized protein LOC124369442 [Homalodisca vitripennis]